MPFIYGAMMGAITPMIEETYQRSNKATLLLFLVGIVICFIGVIIGAIIGDVLYSIFGP